MASFRTHAAPGKELIFALKLLKSFYYYAHKFPVPRSRTAEPFRFYPEPFPPCELIEKTNRYAQALLYRDLARACWNG